MCKVEEKKQQHLFTALKNKKYSLIFWTVNSNVIFGIFCIPRVGVSVCLLSVCVYLCVCLTVCMSVCVSVWVHLFVCLCVCVRVCVYVCVYVHVWFSKPWDPDSPFSPVGISSKHGALNSTIELFIRRPSRLPGDPPRPIKPLEIFKQQKRLNS